MSQFSVAEKVPQVAEAGGVPVTEPDTWRIRATCLSKKFTRSLRQAMWHGLTDAMRRLVGLRRRTDVLRRGEFWALDDVSFDLHRGECLGLVGPNGSGKTTLLRLLHGIYAPDRGAVSLRGRVGALIAAGAGFSPLLTGRENIYVNAALLGLSRREIDECFADIVAFADLGDLLEAPVRHYSSGMQVRLGFAVAAHARPHILLIDEVLAVGDLHFQKKCFEHLHRLKREGTAMVLVSHAPSAVWALCDRGICLDRGRLTCAGGVEDVLRAYKDASGPDEPLPAYHGGPAGGTGDAIVHGTRALDVEGRPRDAFAFGEPVVLESIVEVRTRLSQPIFRYTLDAVQARFIACLDSHEQQLKLEALGPGRYRWRTLIPRQNLMPGRYSLNLAICRQDTGIHLFFQTGACRFQILQPREKFFYGDDNAVLYLESEFQVEPLP